jgi:hypothetical protein
MSKKIFKFCSESFLSRLLYKDVNVKIYRNTILSPLWVSNLVSQIKRRTQVEGLWEQGAGLFLSWEMLVMCRYRQKLSAVVNCGVTSASYKERNVLPPIRRNVVWIIISTLILYWNMSAVLIRKRWKIINCNCSNQINPFSVASMRQPTYVGRHSLYLTWRNIPDVKSVIASVFLFFGLFTFLFKGGWNIFLFANLRLERSTNVKSSKQSHLMGLPLRSFLLFWNIVFQNSGILLSKLNPCTSHLRNYIPYRFRVRTLAPGLLVEEGKLISNSSRAV